MTMQEAPPAPFKADNAVHVSLIVPVYNEEENLDPLVEEIRLAMDRQPRCWNLLFIDDGSSDSSLPVMRSLAAKYENVHYLSFIENQGQSAAFAAGFREAQGSVFVTLDADLQNDPADIPLLLNMYDQGYDMVTGWRADRRDGFAKRTASRIANAIRNRLSHETVRDTGCSLKVFRASMAVKLPLFTGMHRFFPTLMKLQGAKVAEVRVRHRPRLHGKSKYGIWDRAFSSLYDLFAVRWMQKRTFAYRIRERN